MSKETLNDLITFIYCGEVKLTRSNLNEFINTAKNLKIKGCYEQPFDFQTSQPIQSKNAHNGLQYQSSQTVQVQKLANFEYELKPTNLFQTRDDIEFGNDDTINGNGYEMDINVETGSYGNDLNNDDSLMDLNSNVQDDKRNADGGNGSFETPKTTNAPKLGE